MLELKEPLDYIFKQPRKGGYERVVFVVTDGQVSNTEEILVLVSAQTSKLGYYVIKHSSNLLDTRVFSVGIGNAVSHALVIDL